MTISHCLYRRSHSFHVFISGIALLGLYEDLVATGITQGNTVGQVTLISFNIIHATKPTLLLCGVAVNKKVLVISATAPQVTGVLENDVFIILVT